MRVGILVSGVIFLMVGLAWGADPRDEAFDAAWDLAWTLQDQALRGDRLKENYIVYPRAQKTARFFMENYYEYVDEGSAVFKKRCADEQIAVTLAVWDKALQMMHGQVIYLCPRFFKRPTDAQAQSLIHEAAHWAGYMGECAATAVEIYTMDGAGRVPYRNGYISANQDNDRCGYWNVMRYRELPKM